MRLHHRCRLAVAVLTTAACIFQPSVLGAALPSPTLAMHRVGFFEKHASDFLIGGRGDRYIVASKQDRSVLDKMGDGFKGFMSKTVGFMQAAAAGGFAASVVFPIDMAKTRMQACAQSEMGIAASQRTYTGTLQTISKVMAEEGVTSLYRGLGPVLIGSAPEMAIQITAYELSREYIVKKTGWNSKDTRTQLVAGCSAGFMHTWASGPMEVLKVRGQVLGKGAGGLIGTIKTIGIKGLSQGMGSSFALHIPFSCIYFPTFTYVKDKLEKQGTGHFTSSLGAGLVAGSCRVAQVYGHAVLAVSSVRIKSGMRTARREMMTCHMCVNVVRVCSF